MATPGFELEELHRTASVLRWSRRIEGPIRLNLCLTSNHACTRQELVLPPIACVRADAQAALSSGAREYQHFQSGGTGGNVTAPAAGSHRQNQIGTDSPD